MVPLPTSLTSGARGGAFPFHALPRFTPGSGASTLAAPGGLSVEVAGSTYEVTYDAVVGAASYEWRTDSTGAWTNIGNVTSFSSTAAAGAHTVRVRAVDAGAVAGRSGSEGFTIDAVSGTAADWLIDFTGAAGDLVTPTVMDNSTHGTAAGTWSYVVDPTLHTRLASTSVARRTPLTVGGTDYSAATKMLKFDFDEAKSRSDPYEGLKLNFTDGTADDYTITALVQFNGAEGTAVNNDHFVLGGSGFAVAQHQIGFDTSTLCAHGQIAGGASDLGMIIPTEAGVLYSLTLRFNGPGTRVSVCLIDNATGDLVRCSECGLLGSDITYFLLQDYLSIPDSGNTLVALLAGTTSGAFPLEPVTIPQPTGVSATQSNVDKITVAWSGKVTRWRLERSSDAGATWATKTAAATGQFVFGFEDTTVSNGSTYIYRITGLMGDSLESTPLVTDPVTVDNSAFHGAWASALVGSGSGGAGSGERGVEILVGASDIVVTDLGCWFVAGTYGNVAMKIRTNSSTVVASGTVLVAGATVGAYNYITLASPYTMLAGNTYFITRDVSGFNEFPNGPSQAVNSALATRVRGVDETCTDPGLVTPYGGVNFKF